MEKIISLIGKPVKPDAATQSKDRVSFAKYLEEIDINGEPPDEIEFISEIGTLVTQQVVYEWKSLKYTKCSKMGHELKDYKLNERGRKEWRPKKLQERASKQVEKSVEENLVKADKNDVVIHDQVNSSSDPVMNPKDRAALSPIRRPRDAGDKWVTPSRGGRVLKKKNAPVEIRNQFADLEGEEGI